MGSPTRRAVWSLAVAQAQTCLGTIRSELLQCRQRGDGLSALEVTTCNKCSPKGRANRRSVARVGRDSDVEFSCRFVLVLEESAASTKHHPLYECGMRPRK